MMKYVYASRQGKTEKLVQKLGNDDLLKIEDGSETVSEPFVLFTYTDGKGVVPAKVETFLAKNHASLKAVVSTGSMERHPDTYCFAGIKIAETYNVPLLAKADGEGTEEDVRIISEAIASL